MVVAGCGSPGKTNTPVSAPANQNQPTAAPLTTANPLPPTVATQPTNQSLTGIKMVDEQSGWVWNGQSVFRTTDGGATWTEVTPANYQISQENGPPIGNFFLDANTGWIARYDKGKPTIFRTVDGGKSWDSAGVVTKYSTIT